MELYEAVLIGIVSLATCGTIATIIALFTHSPKSRNKAEIDKLVKLKELGLLDAYQSANEVSRQISDIQTRLLDHEQKIEELLEEKSFVRRLLEDKSSEDKSPEDKPK